jgi:hypothetical protein
LGWELCGASVEAAGRQRSKVSWQVGDVGSGVFEKIRANSASLDSLSEAVKDNANDKNGKNPFAWTGPVAFARHNIFWEINLKIPDTVTVYKIQ